MAGSGITAPVSISVPANATGDQIQEALNRLQGPGEVVLQAGTYIIHHPLCLNRDRQSLRGAGVRTRLYLADKSDCPVIILGAPLKSPQHSVSNLRVADLFIDGNRKNQRVELWRTAVDGSLLNNNGIDVWDAKDTAIEGVVCCRCRSGGLVTASGTRRLTVRNFTAYDNQYDGLACYLTEDSHFSKLYLHDNLAAGISLDLNFNHNSIEDALMTGNDLGIFMRDSRENKFQNLLIFKSKSHGVFVAQTAGYSGRGWKLEPGTECIKNSFRQILVSSCGGKAFVVNNASCTDNAIQEAWFVNNSSGGLSEPETKVVAVNGVRVD